MNKKIINCHDVNGKRHPTEIKNLKFRPSVYAVIIKQNKILLSPQWDGYDFPGGGVKIDETLAEGLKREVWEETGYQIKIKGPLYCDTSFFTPRKKIAYLDEYWNCIVIYFTATITGGKISDEHFDEDEKSYLKKAEWIDIKKALKLKFYNSVDSPKLIKQALKIAKQKI